MTAPEPKFNAELAWDLMEYAKSIGEEFEHERVKALAEFLTEKGYHKGATGLRASVEYVEKVAQNIADEFLPIYDILAARRK